MRILLFNALLVCSLLAEMTASAQALRKNKIYGSDLYKVSSMGKYGLETEDGRVILSTEYDDIVFTDSVAVLTKDGGLVCGNVDLDGKVILFKRPVDYSVEYKSYYSDGYMLVRTSKGRYMYVDRNGKYLHDGGTTWKIWFDDDARPFMNGYAAGIRSKDEAWYQVDTNGKERFVLRGETAHYRTTAHNNNGVMECVVVTSSGVYRCQEDPNDPKHYAQRQLLDSSCKFLPVYDSELNQTILKFESHWNSALYLDYKARAIRFYNDQVGDIYFMEEYRPVEEPEPEVVVEEPEPEIPVFDVETDLSIKAANSQVKATSANKANVRFIFKNMSEDAASGDLEVKITYEGQTRSYTFSLNPLEEESRTIVLDARMPDLSKMVTFRIVVKDKETGATQTAKKSVKILSYRG